MTIENSKLPKIATNGFFYTKFHHGFHERIPLAPIKETARRLYCCETTTEDISSKWNCDTEEITQKTGTIFKKGPCGFTYIHVIPKGDYPKTRTLTLDWGR